MIFHVVGIAAKRECLFSFPDRSSRLKGVVTLGGKSLISRVLIKSFFYFLGEKWLII